MDITYLVLIVIDWGGVFLVFSTFFKGGISVAWFMNVIHAIAVKLVFCFIKKINMVERDDKNESCIGFTNRFRDK